MNATPLKNAIDIVKEPWRPGDEDTAYIGLEHINENDLSLNGIGRSAALESNKFRFWAKDILFGKLRPYFRKVVMPDFDGVCSTDIWVMRAREGYDQCFMFYFMANPVLVSQSSGASTGTKMPRADWGFLGNTLWGFPTLIEQEKIAKILSSLDSKIELLRQQNETLEQMAINLFDEWFVRPTTNGTLPSGWNVGTLGEVLDIFGGTTPSTTNPEYWGGEICWSTPKDLTNHKGVFLFDTQDKITSYGLAKISSGLLPVGTLLLSSRAPIGYLAITDVPLAINQGYIAIKPTSRWSNYFTFLWLKTNMCLVEAASNGSTFMEISKGSFRTIECILPDKTTLQEFTETVSPLFYKILNNSKQMRALACLRDTLLPRLMSGEVQTKE